jgi:PAS domain S-box-containing protein
MTKPPLRILHLEDNPTDAELIQGILETEGIICDVTRVDTQTDFFASIEHGGFDLILTDYTLPSFDGLSALKIAQEKCPDVPFIFVSGTLGEEVAIEALKIGATDYILKQRLSRIVPSVHRALRESKERAERKRAEALLSEEKRLLEMIAKGNSLSMILDALCRLVEELSKGSLCSILLLDPDGNRLWHGAAPSLPKSYTDAINGGSIGPAAGSCGTAAYRKEPVIVSDIATDPLWTDYRDLALPHGLRACWSTPVLASDGRVLGTFAIYSGEPGSPTPQQLNIIEQITDLASIAIERKRAEEERQAHLWFLESMDQVNRAIQGTNDLEQMMSDVLDAVLAIFNCDRAWLIYPCDPEAASWKVPMEHARPEFPGAFVLGVDLPVSPEIAKVFQTVRASSGPVRFGPGSEHSLPAETAKRFSIQSMIGMVIYPKGDKPYMLGLHQCSYPRAWAPQEERLFQEIGRRLEDALTSLLIFRNLGESERKLEEAQRLTHVGYWERDLDTDLITWSDESYRIFAVPTAEILSFRRVAELIHPDDLAMVLEAVSAALRGGPRYDLEFRVIRPNGEVRIVHSQADVTWDESGRARRMFGTVQDITERKRAEEELRASETRFRTYVDHATDALFVHDDTRKVVDVNREACESLGYTREELIGMTPRDFDPGRGVDDVFIQWMKERLDAGEVFAFETSHRRKDGTLFPVEVRVRPFWHGGHRFGLALVRDITERKRAEETLRQTEAELAHVARVATLGEMTASIAHEINQPLGAVVNNASACLRWLAASNLEEARQSAELIISDGHRAGEIIDRIRALAKKAPPQKDWVNINETILEVIALARSEVQGNRVALQTQLSDELPLVLGDRIQLQQVILNLVMNGIEAMSAVTDRSRDLLIRSCQYESDKVFVAVQDSGTGLETESLDHLFTAFFTTKPKGMGMGLAISRSIIEAHGGRLWATANEGRGAAFQFTLPAGDERAS